MGQADSDREALLTAAGATRELARCGVDLAESSLKRAADRGEVPVIRTGDHRRVRLFRVSDLIAFARSRRSA